jgi:ribosomal-protein-alanine N-acetyltransferase
MQPSNIKDERMSEGASIDSERDSQSVPRHLQSAEALPKEGRFPSMTSGRNLKEQVRVHIRWMIRRDMPEVLQTELQSFEHAWTEEDFLRCLRQRNCIGMVAEVDETVVGFMIYELHKTKLHILNFAVAPGFRRHGIGRQMIQKLIAKLSSHRRTRVTLAVRETNLPAQLFFRAMAFRAMKVLRGYYEDSGEDAFLMQYQLPGDTSADEDVDDVYDRVSSREDS